jgi:hypothetical protein
MSLKHLRLSDGYLHDAQSDAQSLRGRIDSAFESGYMALLAVLDDDERVMEDHPSVKAIGMACARLHLNPALSMALARRRYSPTERSDLAAVLKWAESIRARARSLPMVR